MAYLDTHVYGYRGNQEIENEIKIADDFTLTIYDYYENGKGFREDVKPEAKKKEGGENLASIIRQSLTRTGL